MPLVLPAFTDGLDLAHLPFEGQPEREQELELELQPRPGQQQQSFADMGAAAAAAVVGARDMEEQAVGAGAGAGRSGASVARMGAGAGAGADADADPPRDPAVQKRAPAPMPAPTPPPTPRGQPEHLRLRTDEFKEGSRRTWQDEGGMVLGPFFGGDEQVEEVKRIVVDQKKSGALRRRRLVDMESPLRPRPREARWEGVDERSGHANLLVSRQDENTDSYPDCFVSNGVLSCYPTAGTDIVQDEWSKFIWNSNYPTFAQAGYVDVYLFHEDSGTIQTSWTSQTNAVGRLSFRPQDAWWQGRTRADDIQAGQNISWPFYFVINPAGRALVGTESRLATWSAIQTAVPVAVASSRSAASASASSDSAASASSVSAASASSASAASASQASASAASARSSAATLTGSAASALSASEASVSSSIVASLSSALVSSLRAQGESGTQTLQGAFTTTLADGQIVTASATGRANGSLNNNDNSSGSNLPKYAIALIVVFGFLALVAAIVGAYFVMGCLRRRRQGSVRGSMGSHSPMMAAAAGPAAGSSLVGGGSTIDGGHEGGPDAERGMLGAGLGGAAAGGIIGAGAMRSSRSSHRVDEDDESHPFTSDEATRMADAFRNALRKPEFANDFGSASQPSPDEGNGNGSPGEEGGAALLREELASEGKDLRDVGERRKATWHNDEAEAGTGRETS